MGNLRLTAVELHVRDVATVAAFYRDVIGVGLEPGDEAATHFECSSGEWGGPDFFSSPCNRSDLAG